ncbi:transthyretin-like family domain-containing protein [Ditylenchus destructor]|nr:transthyretin-like family domain-containing protein [Ditylenchus destructor]
MCHGRGLAGAKVAIYDLDRAPGDSDELLDEKITDGDGKFFLDGTTREWSTIEPELRIFHDCNEDPIRPCQRMWTHAIPDEYIYTSTVEMVYNYGSRELWEYKEDEPRSCDGVNAVKPSRE